MSFSTRLINNKGPSILWFVIFFISFIQTSDLDFSSPLQFLSLSFSERNTQLQNRSEQLRDPLLLKYTSDQNAKQNLSALAADRSFIQRRQNPNGEGAY